MAPLRPSGKKKSTPASAQPTPSGSTIPAEQATAQPTVSVYGTTTGQSFGDEPDPIVRYFGTPGEGFSVSMETSGETLALLRQRFLRRRDLAAFVDFPEGFEFEHHVGDGEHARRVVILTPPKQIAVQHGDGTWTRRQRVASDLTAPYTSQWYMEYIRECNLPGWFLTGVHTGEVRDGAAAHWLGSVLNVPAARTLPPVNYLDLRYPAEPLFPRADAFGDGDSYACEISPDEQHRLARRFPATIARIGYLLANVMSSGHIHLRSPLETRIAQASVPRGAIEWQTLDAAHHLAAYEIESPQTAAAASSIPTQRQDLTQLIDAARSEGGFVNPGLVLRGVGEWHWLQLGTDDVLAEALGYDMPEAVAQARQNGLLAQGIGRNAGPMVVFVPEAAYLNPDERPQGSGHFEYFSQGEGSSEEFAHTNFGGQTDWGFGQTPSPTARDIWYLRQRYRSLIARGRAGDDPTQEVDLVWIPGAVDEQSDESSTASSADTTTTNTQIGLGLGERDRHSGLLHKPRNRGENDQTGAPGSAFYQTRLLPASTNGDALSGARRYTVDRARAHAGTVEHHKGFALTNGGNWRQYPAWDELDWSKPESVEKLNKWREQVFTRHKWPSKREGGRENYPQHQKRWLFNSYVKPLKGSRAGVSIEQVTNVFNKKFGTSRTPTGIHAVFCRLCEQYKKYNGQMKQVGARSSKVKGAERARRKQRTREMSWEEEVEESEDESLQQQDQQEQQAEQSIDELMQDDLSEQDAEDMDVDETE